MVIDQKGAAICKKMDALKSRRHNWERHWQEVAEYVVPKKDNIYGNSIIGEKKYNLLYDSTSIHANELLASALHGMLTNPASIWFGLSTGDDKLDSDNRVREWLQHVVDVMIRTMNQSNFQPQIHEIYIDLGGFGTSYLRVLEDDEYDVLFESRPIYEAVIAENHRGEVITVYYEYDMTVQQIALQFGEDILDNMLKDKLREDPLHKERVIHAVEPREFVPFKNPNIPKNMPFASYHILKRNKMILKESGFKENPNIITRWTKLSAEVYGRGPGMKTLSDIKMLNRMKKATIEAAQLSVAPPLQVPDDGVLLPIKTAPNSINYFRAGTKDRIEPLFTGVKLQEAQFIMESTKQQIREGFFIDQLQLIQQDRMTTTEVLTRRDEQLRTLGPILGRLHSELLRPLVDRVFAILLRKGRFRPAPQILAGRELEVRYISQIAKAQRMAEAENVTRGMQFLAPFLETKPEILDNFTGDGLVAFASDIFGIPEKILNTKRERESIRQGRQEAMSEQSELDTAQQEVSIAGAAQGLINPEG